MAVNILHLLILCDYHPFVRWEPLQSNIYIIQNSLKPSTRSTFWFQLFSILLHSSPPSPNMYFTLLIISFSLCDMKFLPFSKTINLLPQKLHHFPTRRNRLPLPSGAFHRSSPVLALPVTGAFPSCKRPKLSTGSESRLSHLQLRSKALWAY